METEPKIYLFLAAFVFLYHLIVAIYVRSTLSVHCDSKNIRWYLRALIVTSIIGLGGTMMYFMFCVL